MSAVRSFNRLWTRQIGVLQARLLDTPYSLTEARLIFELAQRGTSDLTELHRGLNLDAGYVSRVLNRLKGDELVRSEVAPFDARRQILSLTDRGWDVFTDLDRRASDQVRSMLDGLSTEARRLLFSAMSTIEGVLELKEPDRAYVIRPLQPGDLGWIVHRHGVLYAEEYGWDDTFEALVAKVVADFGEDREPQRENAWVAEMDGAVVGSVFCCKKDEETAQLRLLFVEPGARGHGIGARLVQECIRFARRRRYKQMMLWTNDVLVSARRIYEAAGFQLAEEEPHHSFGQDLVGQNWVLDLVEEPS